VPGAKRVEEFCDRGLSRLLGSDWPRTLEELEALTRAKPGAFSVCVDRTPICFQELVIYHG